MQLVVLSPDAPLLELPLGSAEVDLSDSATLTWIDLDRSEAHELPRVLAEIPIPLARDLLDPSQTAQLRERGGLRWLSLFGVAHTPGGRDLGDLDIIVGPGLLITIHSGERPALRRLREPAMWRRPLAPPLSEAALGLVLDATLDAYDDLAYDAEEEVDRLQHSSQIRTGRARRADLLRHRRHMISVRRRLASERELFGQLARPRSSSIDGRWWINDRLEAAVAAAQDAADYALATSWSLAGDSRRRMRDLGLVLIASWVTFLVVVGVVRLSSAVEPGGVDPVWFAGGILLLVSLIALATAWRRRWS